VTVPARGGYAVAQKQADKATGKGTAEAERRKVKPKE